MIGWFDVGMELWRRGIPAPLTCPESAASWGDGIGKDGIGEGMGSGQSEFCSLKSDNSLRLEPEISCGQCAALTSHCRHDYRPPPAAFWSTRTRPASIAASRAACAEPGRLDEPSGLAVALANVGLVAYRHMRALSPVLLDRRQTRPQAKRPCARCPQRQTVVY